MTINPRSLGSRSLAEIIIEIKNKIPAVALPLSSMNKFFKTLVKGLFESLKNIFNETHRVYKFSTAKSMKIATDTYVVGQWVSL